MKNEKGTVLLLSLTLVFILSLLLLHSLSLYETEKQFLKMEKEWNTLDNLLLTGAAGITNLMENSDGSILSAGKIKLENGEVNYRVTLTGESEALITLTAETVAGTIKTGRFYYNSSTGEINNWEEGRRLN
ncbi:ComGG family competence protein [Evansella sp. LMS18]|uniref:competence type IV pilus minor pilin ComGG n=1 Tax=Evansella sp. LMS18 TaxID=2924033 RepID=UPI0020D02E7F|nr:competence type IV pilus minor pilin ComGG [Evansella sp. LMS18]UTR09443.1 ComGG family competence protein [Evansella sp. LMS18]